MNFFPKYVDLGMLLYVGDSKSCNFGDVSIWFYLVENTYVSVLPCGTDDRSVIKYMLYERGAEAIDFSDESDDCEGGDIVTYVSSV
jgi:hypothetical protein